jgi:uncharacterized protein
MAPNDRRCVSCRRVAPKSDLWRVVRLAKTTTVCLDQGMGRSAYLCPQADCLRLAQRKNRLGRSLRVPIPDSLWPLLWQRLDPATNPGQAPKSGVSELATVGAEANLGNLENTANSPRAMAMDLGH